MNHSKFYNIVIILLTDIFIFIKNYIKFNFRKDISKIKIFRLLDINNLRKIRISFLHILSNFM